MKISLRLSSKVNANGLSEIMLSTKIRIKTRVTTLRAKSEVFVSPVFFSEEKGVDLSKKRVITAETRKLHNEAKEKLDGILSAIAKTEESVNKEDLSTDWLKDVVEHHLHPERFQPQIAAGKTVYEYAQVKDIFTLSGITRNVEVRNAKTGEMEIRQINEIASSHLARRTFVGNAYRKVSDPNIIGKMSGHVEGSKAFSRYRNIEDETLKNVIDLIG